MLVIKQFGPVTYAMGTLQEILAGTGIAAKVRALPNDVAGCTLEMGADGKWVGTLGSLSEATADALYASGALVNLATGVTYRDTSGIQYTYSAGAGWVALSRAMTTKQPIIYGVFVPYGEPHSAVSYVQQSSVNSDFIGMKLVFRNNSDNPITITTAKIATTATDLDNGASLTWVQVTVAGSNSFTIPARTVNGGSPTPGEIISDFCSVTSSTAVNGERIFQVRAYADGPIILGKANGIAPVIRSTYGVLAAMNATGGDKVTSPAVAFAPAITGTNAGWIIFSGVILYQAGTAVPAILDTGDSIANGFGGTFGVGNPLFIARKTSARAFSVDNCGTPGQTTADSLAIAEANVSKGYSAIVTGMYSPNDWGNHNYPLNFAKMCDVIDKILASGAIAIVYTPAPYSGAEPALDTNERLYWTQRCLALAGPRIRVFDRNASVGDPANPGKYLPAYTNDNVHTNDAGCAKLAADFLGIILSAL